jgi:hypothetical protein
MRSRALDLLRLRLRTDREQVRALDAGRLHLVAAVFEILCSGAAGRSGLGW